MVDVRVNGQHATPGDGVVGVPYGEFAAAFPEVFETSHTDQSLGLGTAEELLAAVDHRGRTPEDVAFLRDFVLGTDGAWTEAARRRFDVSLFGPPLRQPGQVFFTGRNGHGAVVFPTMDMLLNGLVPTQAFSASLRAVVDGQFGGDLARVPRPRGISLGEFRRYLAGEALPETHRQAFAVASAFQVVDPEGLMTAWLADMNARGDDAGIPFLLDGTSSLERQRYETLLRSAHLVLRDSTEILVPNSSLLVSPVQAARYARRAMRAGFDAETVIGVVADYAGTQRGFFDGVFEEAKMYIDVGHPELAVTAYWLAAEHSRKLGDHSMAGVLFATTADTLKETALQRFGQWELARQEALKFYALALEEHDLFRSAVVGDFASLETEDGFRARVEASIAELEGIASDVKGGNGFGGPAGGGQVGGLGGPQGSPPAGPGGNGAQTKAASFGGITVIEGRGLLETISRMPSARRQTVQEFASSSPEIWQWLVGGNRMDLVEAAFAVAANGTHAEVGPDEPVSFAIFSLALRRLAIDAGFIAEERSPVGIEQAGYVLTGATHVFGGIEIPIGALGAGAGFTPAVR